MEIALYTLRSCQSLLDQSDSVINIPHPDLLHLPVDFTYHLSSNPNRSATNMSSTAYDDMSKEERDAYDAAEAAREKAEQAGQSINRSLT
jgi:hypothetical protein